MCLTEPYILNNFSRTRVSKRALLHERSKDEHVHERERVSNRRSQPILLVFQPVEHVQLKGEEKRECRKFAVVFSLLRRWPRRGSASRHLRRADFRRRTTRSPTGERRAYPVSSSSDWSNDPRRCCPTPPTIVRTNRLFEWCEETSDREEEATDQ